MNCDYLANRIYIHIQFVHKSIYNLLLVNLLVNCELPTRILNGINFAELRCVIYNYITDL